MDYFAPFSVGLSGLDGLPRNCIWGVGYCDLKAEPSHPPLDLVRRIVAGSELCVVRDELTRVLGGQRPRGTCRLPEPGRSQCTARWMGGASRRQLHDGRCRGLQGNGCCMPTLHLGHGATVSPHEQPDRTGPGDGFATMPFLVRAIGCHRQFGTARLCHRRRDGQARTCGLGRLEDRGFHACGRTWWLGAGCGRPRAAAGNACGTTAPETGTAICRARAC